MLLINTEIKLTNLNYVKSPFIFFNVKYATLIISQFEVWSWKPLWEYMSQHCRSNDCFKQVILLLHKHLNWSFRHKNSLPNYFTRQWMKAHISIYRAGWHSRSRPLSALDLFSTMDDCIHMYQYHIQPVMKIMTQRMSNFLHPHLFAAQIWTSSLLAWSHLASLAFGCRFANKSNI